MGNSNSSSSKNSEASVKPMKPMKATGNIFGETSAQAPKYPTQYNPKAPFSNKDPFRTDILICNDGLRSFGGSDDRWDSVLDTLKKVFGGEKANATIVSNRFHGEAETMTLTIPGYQLLVMGPRMRWSRMHNQKADVWYDQAYENADCFVYMMNIPKNVEKYLNPAIDTCPGRGWELDRTAVAQLLQKPSLMENPRKPLLLLVSREDACLGEDDLDLERLVNLCGLGGDLGRPFRAAACFKTHSSAADGDRLKEALNWLAKTAASADDATARTEIETEDEGSIATTTSTLFSNETEAYVLDYVLDYQPTLFGGNPTLQRFEPIKKGTHCPFARGAKLWGGKVIDELKPRLYRDPKSTVEEAAVLNAGPLAEFVARSNNSNEPLDGFCLEIPRADYVSPEVLGESVRHLLTKLAELDPSPGENAMKMGPIDQPHWRFHFAGEDFFIITFSPVYKKDSSRYSFGAHKAFALFQPIKSFGRHGLTNDTPASATNWSNPTSMRDKARVAYKENGRPYYIPEELPYPVAEHIVKPDKDDGTSCIRWWEPLPDEAGGRK